MSLVVEWAEVINLIVFFMAHFPIIITEWKVLAE